jgi:hypothetical protein
MFRWVDALRGDLVLDEKAKEKLWKPSLNDYACGWDVLETPRGRLVQHDGGSDLGASAELRWFVDEDVLIVLFCNRSYQGVPLFEVVREEIEELAFGGEVQAPPPTIAMDEESLKRYEGNYRMPTGGGLQISIIGGMLTLRTFDQDVINALFLPDGDPEAFEDLNARTNRIVAAAVSGASEVFVREFGDTAAANRVMTLLQRDLAAVAERYGSPLTAAVSLGTAPMREGGAVISGVRVRTASGGAEDMSFWWRDGRVFGIDQLGFEMSIPLAPVAEDEFVGYHLAFAMPFRAIFELDEDGAVTGVTLGSRRATRVGGTVHPHKHENAHGHGHDQTQEHAGEGS